MNRNRYLVALVDGGGTVPVELGVVRRLVERGHDVTVLAEDSMVDDVRATGATFRRWVEAPNRPDRSPEHDPYRDWECKGSRQLFATLLEKQFAGPLRQYAADVDAAIAEHRPDIVLCAQFAFGAMVAAEAAAIPFDVLMPNIYILPGDGITPFGLGLRPAKGAPGQARDSFLRSMTHRMWDKGLTRLNTLREERGLEPVAHFMDQPTPRSHGVGAHVGGVRLRRPGAGQRPLRRARARRSELGRSRTGLRRRVMTRWCSSGCRRRSRTMPVRSSASSTPCRRCRCAPS